MTDLAHLTRLLASASTGDMDARDRLLAVVYEELRAIARVQLATERDAHTLQPTALVHEAYLRLFGRDTNGQFENRRHFFAAVANAMRRIRVDDARKRRRIKRGGGRRPASLEDDLAVFEQDHDEVLALHEALERLKGRDPRKAELVTLRYFAGLTIDECATAMEVSPRSVDNEWRFARAWLARELSKGDTSAAATEDP